MGGFISGILGTNNDFQAATGNSAVDKANADAATALAQQQAFAQAAGTQNGLGNQASALGGMQGLTNQLAGANGVGLQSGAGQQAAGLAGQLGQANGVGAQQAALGQSGMLSNQLAGANGVGGLANAMGSQNALAQALSGGVGVQNSAINQLQGVANGTGPNPAQAMLNQATGANVANQAAMMAGQRGAGANVALMGRQAAMQGSNIQQQAAGQGATMQANQSLNAMGQLGQLGSQQVGQQQAALQGAGGVGAQLAGLQQSNAGQMASIGAGLTGQQLNATGQQANIGQGITNQQGNMLGQQAGVAGQQVGQQLSGNQQQANTALGVQGTSQNALNNQNQINSGVAQQNTNTNKAIIGGLINGASAAATGGMSAMSPGGGSGGSFTSSGGGYNSNNYAQGGMVDTHAQIQPEGPRSMLAKHAKGGFTHDHTVMMAHGGHVSGSAKKVPAMLSPGEKYIPPSEVKKVAKGKDPIDAGKKVPGKAKVKGNSLKNDTVPATLEEGGVVIPKSVMESKHPHWAAKKFVEAIIAKQGLKK